MTNIATINALYDILPKSFKAAARARHFNRPGPSNEEELRALSHIYVDVAWPSLLVEKYKEEKMRNLEDIAQLVADGKNPSTLFRKIEPLVERTPNRAGDRAPTPVFQKRLAEFIKNENPSFEPR